MNIDVNKTIKEIEETCIEYGFMNRKVMPYGFGIEVERLLSNWKDYDLCTIDSQSVIRDEIKGFLPILERWIDYENQPMVKVKIIKGDNAGQFREYHKSTADTLIEAGLAI